MREKFGITTDDYERTWMLNCWMEKTKRHKTYNFPLSSPIKMKICSKLTMESHIRICLIALLTASTSCQLCIDGWRRGNHIQSYVSHLTPNINKVAFLGSFLMCCRRRIRKMLCVWDPLWAQCLPSNQNRRKSYKYWLVTVYIKLKSFAMCPVKFDAYLVLI